MTKDWASSRFQFLNELRRRRHAREEVGHDAPSPATPASGEVAPFFDALYRLAGALATPGPLAESAVPALQALAESTHWEAGMLWTSREPDGLLGFTACWAREQAPVQDLVSLSRQATFLAGRSPLGHLWGEGGRPTLYDLRLEGRSPRALYAVRANLPQVLLVPLWHEAHLLGFFEFFGQAPNLSYGEQAKLWVASAQQVVQRLLRERAEGRLDSLAAPASEFAVLDLDTNGHIRRWSKEAEHLTGFLADDVTGAHVSLLHPPSEAEAAVDTLQAAALDGCAKRCGWQLRKDGERFEAETFAWPRRAPHGEVTGFSLAFRPLPWGGLVERDRALPSEPRERSELCTSSSQEEA